MAVSFQRGTMGELVPLIEQMAADNPELAAAFAAALALAHVEAGRIDDARRLLEEFAAADFDLPLDPIWLTGMVAVRRSRHRVPGPEVRRAAVRPARPVGRSDAHVPALTADGPVSHYLGGLATVLGRYDEADAYFTQAAAFNDRADAKFFAARTNLSWGKMLAERNAPGDTERARDLLTKAHTAAAAHGYANVERRAAEALQHLADRSSTAPGCPPEHTESTR